MSIADFSNTLPRTYLFVPASRPERIAKALNSGVDAVIVDLEDAVADQDKATARTALRGWLTQQAASVYVRINAKGTPWYDADVAAFGHHPQIRGLVVPKAADVACLARLAEQCRPQMQLLPIIESAAGLANIRAIAAVGGVQRLLFGTIDFQVDLGTQLSEPELNPFRTAFPLASRLAGIASPVDGVSTVLDDPDALQAAAQQAKRYGFGAKLCIHPKQVAPVHAGFRPTASECAWAQRVLAAVELSAGAATVVDGEMVDVPVIQRARSILHSQAACLEVSA